MSVPRTFRTCLALLLGLQSACLAEFPADDGSVFLGLLLAANLNDTSTLSGARVVRTTSLAVADSTVTTISYDMTDFDTAGMTNTAITSGSFDGLTTTAADLYFLSGGVDYDTAAGGTRALQFVDPGVVSGGQITRAVMGAPTAHSMGQLRSLNAGARIGLQTLQTFGATLNTTPDRTTSLALLRMDRAALSSALVRQTAPQAIASGAPVVVNFDSSDYDTGGYFNAAQSDRLTIAEAGVYLVVANTAMLSSGVADTRGVELQVNGTTSIARDIRTNAAASAAFQGAHAVYQFAAGDFIQLRYFQNSGANQPLQAQTTLSIARLDSTVSSARSMIQRRPPAGIAGLASGAATSVDLSEVDRADAAFTVTNASTTTIVESGLYLTVANLYFATAAGGNRRRIDLVVNGSIDVSELRQPIAGGNGTLNLIALRNFSAGDTVRLRAIHNSGGTLAVQTPATFFQMIKLD